MVQLPSSYVVVVTTLIKCLLDLSINILLLLISLLANYNCFLSWFTSRIDCSPNLSLDIELPFHQDHLKPQRPMLGRFQQLDSKCTLEALVLFVGYFQIAFATELYPTEAVVVYKPVRTAIA